ncbi:MAG: caspase family protein [Desulfobacteraceae bacterium]|nr:caspase family protein [Desulfobacteraceae bacterium]
MRRLTITIFMIFVVLLLLCANLLAKQRGIRVKALSVDGSTKEIQLYSSYYALVVGCGSYRNGWPRLPNPVRDAIEVKDALGKLGFEVKFVKNPDGHQLRRALNGLVSTAGRDSRKGIFVFFAGHGHTLTRADGTKLGYIVPVDAPDPEKELTGFMTRAVSMREIEEISTLIKAKHVLMVFDSCFSGAIFRANPRRPSQYIREQVTKPVRAFITAGNKQERVPDVSVFKTSLLQGLMDRYADRNKDGYVTGEELGLYLKEEVVNYTGGTQHPQYGKINNPKLDKGNFVFCLDKGRSRLSSSIEAEKQHLTEERARLDAERKRLADEQRRLEEGRKLAEERRRLARERATLEATRKRLEEEKSQQRQVASLAPHESSSPTTIIYDPRTGLEWHVGPDKNTTWYEAQAWIQKLTVEGGGWRMPAMAELKGLYKKGGGTRNMDSAFKTTGWVVWSGETKGSSSAWHFSFNRGYATWVNCSNSYYRRVFAVRPRR